MALFCSALREVFFLFTTEALTCRRGRGQVLYDIQAYFYNFCMHIYLTVP